MQVGPYEVLGEPGRGGMGIVLRARGPGGSIVAVKVLRRRQTPDALARFDRERRLLDALREEQGFVPILDSGEAAQGPYIVLPFLDGGTLRDRIDGGPLPLADAVRLA